MKMQRKSWLTLTTAGLLLSSAAVMAYGGGHGYDKEGCHHESPMKTVQQLDNLTDEQRTALRKLYSEQRDTMRKQRDAMREGRKAIRDALQKGVDKKQLQALADKQGEQVAAMIMLRAGTQEKLAGILTAEQMKQLQEMRQERMERHPRW